MEDKQEEKKAKNMERYTKQQIMSANKFKSDVDILQAFLEDDKTYTLSEAEKVIDNFKKGKVM